MVCGLSQIGDCNHKGMLRRAFAFWDRFRQHSRYGFAKQLEIAIFCPLGLVKFIFLQKPDI